MLNKRRTRKAAFALESLDDRIVPSAMSAQMGGHAALEARLALQAEHRVQLMEAREARLHARLEARAALMAARHNHVAVRPSIGLPLHMGGQHVVMRNMFGGGVNGSTTGRTGAVAGPAGGSISPVGQQQSGGGGATSSPTNTQNPGGGTTNNEKSLPQNVDSNLDKIYQDYQNYVSNGSSGTFTTSESAIVFVSGTDVGINAHGNGSGSFDAYLAALKGLGMQVQASDSNHETVSGMIPISALPNAATLSQTFSLSPMYKPKF